MHGLMFHNLYTAFSKLFYLDPGNGSLIIQLILGALLAIGLSVRIFWGKIKVLIGQGRTGMAEPKPVQGDQDNLHDPK